MKSMRSHASRWLMLNAILMSSAWLYGQGQVVAEAIYGAPPEVDAQQVEFRSTFLEQSNGDLVIRIGAVNVQPLAVDGTVEYRVSRDWKLLSYLMHAKSDDPHNSFEIDFSCEVRGTIACGVDKGEASPHWSMPETRPLMLFCCEDVVYGDIIFGEAAALMSVPHSIRAKIGIPLVMPETDDSGTTRLKVAETEEFEYLGRKTISLAIGTVEADVFQTKDETFWLSPSGLLLAISEAPDSAPTFALKSIEKGKERYLPGLVASSTH